jgi:aminoglycoside 6'-N-acetyltransferase
VTTSEPDSTPPPTIPGKRVLLRRLGPEDRPRLRAILADPEVARWWAPRGPDQAVDDLFDAREVVYAIEVDGVVVGAIEYSEENGPDYRHAGIDIFLNSTHQGQGLGGAAIRVLAGYLFDVRGHHRLTIDPAVANERAVRAYGRVGFRPVGVMRAYERDAHGTWHDGLLMDLLAGELTPEPE